MSQYIHKWLRNIHLNDPIEREQALVLQLMLIGLCSINLPALLINLTTNQTGATWLLMTIAIMLVTFCFVGSLALLRRGHFKPAIATVVVGVMGGFAALVVPAGVRDAGVLWLIPLIPITLAGLVGGRRTLWMAVVGSVVIVFGIAALEAGSSPLVGYDPPGGNNAIPLAVGFLLMTGVIGLFFEGFGSSLRNALAISRMREQELERIRASQETIIGERTAALQDALREVEQREARLSNTLEELRSSQAVVRELSAPVVPVLPGVLVAPLVGAMDSARAEVFTDNVLSAIEQRQARMVIFDITGVPIVDSHVAQVLAQTANAIQLLGARVLLVGIRPEVAQVLVSLNVNLGAIVTYPDLQEAIVTIIQREAWDRVRLRRAS